jgi:hypothetical protein
VRGRGLYVTLIHVSAPESRGVRGIACTGRLSGQGPIVTHRQRPADPPRASHQQAVSDLSHESPADSMPARSIHGLLRNSDSRTAGPSANLSRKKFDVSEHGKSTVGCDGYRRYRALLVVPPRNPAIGWVSSCASHSEAKSLPRDPSLLCEDHTGWPRRAATAVSCSSSSSRRSRGSCRRTGAQRGRRARAMPVPMSLALRDLLHMSPCDAVSWGRSDVPSCAGNERPAQTVRPASLVCAPCPAMAPCSWDFACVASEEEDGVVAFEDNLEGMMVTLYKVRLLPRLDCRACPGSRLKRCEGRSRSKLPSS